MNRLLNAASAAALLAVTLGACATPGGGSAEPVRAKAPPIQAQDSYYTQAQTSVASRIAERGSPRAKNVILFVGDGMGISTVTAARIYTGQSKGVEGESYRLAMESLPWSAFSKTYTHDAQVADSAPTAAAMTTGVKSANGTIGVTQGASPNDCTSATRNSTKSLWAIAEEAGLSTGVISTARFTHATPGATYAVTTERDWEDDSAISAAGKAAGCTDIAAQFVAWDHGDGIDVAFGGGRGNFLPNTMADPEYPDRNGRRQDGRDLMAEWKAKSPRRVVVTDQAGFDALDLNSDMQVFGLFEPSHMQYEIDRAGDGKGEPSIADMTRAAITRLSRNPEGYLLMVEGGRVDHGHHAGNAARALSDAAALDEAVRTALEMTDAKETLIIVTADHSHTLTIQGYPARNNPILGLARSGVGAPMRGSDGKTYTTLSYANGPGAICVGTDPCVRPDPAAEDTTAINYRQQALIPMGSETHGGEDVPIYASGPGGMLLTGTVEQHEIFHVMGRSLRLIE